MPDSLRRAIRTLLQLIASGGLTALVDSFAGGLSPESATLLLMINTVLVTFLQNYLEDNTSFPAILKAPASPGENPTPKSAA